MLGLARRWVRGLVSEGTEPAAQGRAELVGGLGFALGRRLGRLEPPRMPQVDVEPLDLLDQEQDRAPGCPHLVAGVVQQPFAPGPQGFDLVFVEALRRQSLLGSACS